MKLLSRTTEYTITVAFIVGNVAASLEGVYSGKWAGILAVVASSAYAISRGLAKSGPLPPK